MILGIVPVLVTWLVDWSGYRLDTVASAVAMERFARLLALGVVALFVQGVSFNGLSGFLLTAAILAAIDWLLPMFVAYLTSGIAAVSGG